MKEKFVQLPSSLRMIVVLFIVLGLSSFWVFGKKIEAENVIDIGPLIRGIFEWSLAMGLINKRNDSRLWVAFFTFLGFLFGLFLFGVAVFVDPNTTVGFNFSYDKLTRTQTIIFILGYIVVSGGAFIILVMSKTKSLFSQEK